MKFTVSQIMLLAGSAIAAPVEVARRAALTDADILNFALTLEHLENTFYMEALAKFPEAAFEAQQNSPRLRFNLQEISSDETTHVNFLTSALKEAGATPVEPCSYDFGLTDVESFLALDQVLEAVGVSAYLGAASLISSKEYLTAAGSILTVEARHNAYIRDNQMNPGPMSPFPNPFDIPLDPMQVYTLASQFITSCPKGSALPFTAFPSLELAMSDPMYLREGYPVTVMAPTVDLSSKGPLYCAFPQVAGTSYEPATVSGKTATCMVPMGVAGNSYVILTTSSKMLADSNTVAGPAILTVQSKYTYPGFPM